MTAMVNRLIHTTCERAFVWDLHNLLHTSKKERSKAKPKRTCSSARTVMPMKNRCWNKYPWMPKNASKLQAAVSEKCKQNASCCFKAANLPFQNFRDAASRHGFLSSFFFITISRWGELCPRWSSVSTRERQWAPMVFLLSTRQRPIFSFRHRRG